MSDTEPTDEVEAPQSEAPPTDSPPPWGEDFQPDRAWQTITHLRGREKELESEAKRFKALREDPDALREFLAEQGYELPEDEPEVTPSATDDDPTADLRSKLTEIEEWKANQEAAAAKQAFDAHLDVLAGEDYELTDRDRAIILRESLENGFTKKTTEEAFKAHRTWLEEQFNRHRQSWQETKKAPAPASTSGKSATQVPDLDDPKTRHNWLIEQVNKRDQD